MTENDTIGVLLMAHGGPDKLEDIPEFLKHVLNGRPVPPPLVSEIEDNYRQIGGSSPIRVLTQKQADALESKLNSQANGTTYKTYIAMKNWTPWIWDTVEQIANDGIKKLVVIVLAPQYSSVIIGRYLKIFEQALEDKSAAFQYVAVDDFHDHPLMVKAWAELIMGQKATMPDAHVVFSGHSIPVRIIDAGDPYSAQLEKTAQLVAKETGLADDEWSLCYQSSGRSREPWLGPEMCQHIMDLADDGHKNLLFATVGFVSEHVEVLYDVDVHARQVAEKNGMKLERVQMLNDHPLFVEALADLVKQKERDLSWRKI